MKKGCTIRHVACKTIPAGTWQVRWYEKIRGKSDYSTKNFKTRAEAQEFAAEIGPLKRAAKAAHGLMREKVRPDGLISELLPRFIEEVRARSKIGSEHPKTLEYYIRRFSAAFDLVTTRDITAPALQRIMATLADRKRSRKQLHAAFHNFAKWYESDWWCDSEIFELKVKAHRYTPREDWTDEQVRAIFDIILLKPLQNCSHWEPGSPERKRCIELARRAANARAFLAPFRLMVLWGPRPLEVTRLTVGDLRTDTKKLRITSENAKNGRARYLPLDSKTFFMLASLCHNRAPEEPLFRVASGSAWSAEFLGKFANAMLRLAGVPGSLYCARHTACTRIVGRLGMDSFRDAMEITGHLTMSEFLRYLHASRKAASEEQKANYAAYLDDMPNRSFDVRQGDDDESDPPAAMAIQR